MEKPKKKDISLPPITSPGGRISIRVTKVAPDPPVKPSGPSFIDRSSHGDVAHGLAFRQPGRDLALLRRETQDRGYEAPVDTRSPPRLDQ